MKRILLQFFDGGKFSIVFQSHRGNEFGVRDGHSSYVFTNKLMSFYSASCPEITGISGLYVRGEDKTRDRFILQTNNPLVLERYATAANDYNEYYKE